MSVKQISVEQARQFMDDDSDVIYIDVRTPAEYDRGHPPGAINIPVALPNSQTRQMALNPEFLHVVEKRVPRTARVIVGCQVGRRSQFAGERMLESGYTDVSNMQGGFGGDRNPMGEISVPGWQQMGYEVEMEAPRAASYEELKK
jgi:rhodanese-related sulfurtransferase